MRILVLANDGEGLYKFRKEVFIELLKNHEVYASLPVDKYKEKIESLGIKFIETEFKIDPNFLKLLRLGPNVKNFISLSATERKSFIKIHRRNRLWHEKTSVRGKPHNGRILERNCKIAVSGAVILHTASKIRKSPLHPCCRRVPQGHLHQFLCSGSAPT